MTQHSPTPWKLSPAPGGFSRLGITDCQGKLVAISYTAPDAEFILRACNAYDDLLAALRSIARRPCFAELLSEDTSECGCPCCTARAAVEEAEKGA